jgi:hypothetical protein
MIVTKEGEESGGGVVSSRKDADVRSITLRVFEGLLKLQD